jgi:hypothetical protein
MSALKHVQIAPLPPQRFKEILTDEQSRQLDETIARGDELLGNRVVWNVNSTMRGGGVAEMLASLVAYGRGAGVDPAGSSCAGIRTSSGSPSGSTTCCTARRATARVSVPTRERLTRAPAQWQRESWPS